ncbi:MAG: acyl carrier protein [Acidimicrobiales bacterium]
MDADEVFSTFQDAAAEVLGVEPAEVTREARFKEDLKADSLDLVELVMALEERLDITVPEEDLEEVETVGDALKVVLDKVAART